METHGLNGDEISLYDCWKTIVKRKKIIIGLFLIAVILTALINLLTTKVYKCEAIFKLNTNAKDIITPRDIIDIIGHRKEKVFEKNLNSVKALKIVEVRESTDKLKVTIDSTNIETIDNVFAEFANKVSNFPKIKEALENQKKRIEDQIKKISSTISEYDEFTKYYVGLLKERKLTVITFNPVDLKQRAYDLEEQKALLEKTLKNWSLFESTQVTISKKLIKPQLQKNIILAGTVSLILGIFLVLFMDFRDKRKV